MNVVKRWSAKLPVPLNPFTGAAASLWARLGSNQCRTSPTKTDLDPVSPALQRKDTARIFAAGPALGDESSGDVVVGWSAARPRPSIIADFDNGFAERWPWQLRHSLLTAWDHAEMLGVLARVTEAFDELGAAA